MYKKKCAEIFYENIENFSFVCTQCNLETFQYNDFRIHFKEVHCSNDSFVIKTENNMDEIFQQKSNPEDTLYEMPIEISCNKEIFVDFEENIKIEDESLDNRDRLEFVSDSADDDDVPLKLIGNRTRRRKSNRSKIDTEGNVQQSNSCDDCGKVFKSRKSLLRHVKQQHETGPRNSEIFHCKNCSKKYVTKSALRAHERMKHSATKEGTKPGSYPCTICEKIYTDKYCLKDHLLRHLGEKNFICDVPNCKKTFFTRKNLNFHVKNIHVAEKNYVCEMCGHSTKTAACLVMHKRSHTGEKPFNCPTCGKAFASMSGVREHEVSHNAKVLRPHVCKICGKTFARPKALYHHMPLHSDTKKFVCKICGKAYSQLAGLSAHKRQHSLNNFGEET